MVVVRWDGNHTDTYYGEFLLKLAVDSQERLESSSFPSAEGSAVLFTVPKSGKWWASRRHLAVGDDGSIGFVASSRSNGPSRYLQHGDDLSGSTIEIIGQPEDLLRFAESIVAHVSSALVNTPGREDEGAAVVLNGPRSTVTAADIMKTLEELRADLSMVVSKRVRRNPAYDNPEST
jgi:hypothetical protein